MSVRWCVTAGAALVLLAAPARGQVVMRPAPAGAVPPAAADPWPARVSSIRWSVPAGAEPARRPRGGRGWRAALGAGVGFAAGYVIGGAVGRDRCGALVSCGSQAAEWALVWGAAGAAVGGVAGFALGG